MASRLVGRTACPECGFAGAHVKQSEKCLYRYCPECGATYYCRGGRQAADLQAKTRPVDAPTATGSPTASPPPAMVATPAAPGPLPTPTPTATAEPAPAPEPAPEPAPAPPAPPVRRRSGFF